MSMSMLALQTLDNLICSSSECYSWIIVLLNILAVFYLVFCSFYKSTRLVKTIGWIFGGALIVGDVAVVAFHTCLFTLISSVFSVMMFLAIVASIFQDSSQAKSKSSDNFGSYVISKNRSGFYFEIYDKSKNLLASSNREFASLEETKIAIEECRNLGSAAELADTTSDWVKQIEHPKFILFRNNSEFVFVLDKAQNDRVLTSIGSKSKKACLKLFDVTQRALQSPNVYMLAKCGQRSSDNYATNSDDVAGARDSLATASFKNDKNTIDQMYALLSEIDKYRFDRLMDYLNAKDNVEKVQNVVEEDKEALVKLLTDGNLSVAGDACGKLCILSKMDNSIYCYFNQFASLLESKNSLVRNRAIALISANVRWDNEDKFGKIADSYLSCISDDRPLTARKCIKSLAEILKYKPAYAAQVKMRLKNVDTTKYDDRMKKLVEKDINKALQEIA